MAFEDDHKTVSPGRPPGMALAVGLLWLCLAGGTFVGLLPGDSTGCLTPWLPVSLTLAAVSIVGLSSLCLWGLLFTLPGYLLADAWLRRRLSWALPALLLAQAGVTSLQQALAGVAPWPSTLYLLATLAGLQVLCLAADRGRQVQKLLGRKARLLKRWLRRQKHHDAITPKGVEARHD